jgi:hypothetical protein
MADEFSWLNAGSLSDKNEKCSLEGILGILRIVKQSAANTQNHWPVTTDQRLARIGVAVVDEVSEQLAVCEDWTASLPADHPNDASQWAVEHDVPSVAARVP